MPPSPRIFLVAVLLFSGLHSAPAAAQDAAPSSEGESCLSANIVSTPSRPTVTNATDPTQCGVLEAEYGFESQWPGGGSRRDDFTGGFRLGLTQNLDLHYAAGDYLGILNSASPAQRGFGDTWLGLKYRFLKQTVKRPSLGVFYQAKVPTGDALLGLGSGQVDHLTALLVSKDVRKFHFDFNVIPTFVGRPVGGGYDHNVGFAWSTSLPVSKKFSLVTEPYGYTALNSATPGYASVMAGITYQARRRMFFDTGMDFGVMHGAPQKRFYGGVTYAIANAFRWLKPAQ
jgi:hypothetical protein